MAHRIHPIFPDFIKANAHDEPMPLEDGSTGVYTRASLSRVEEETNPMPSRQPRVPEQWTHARFARRFAVQAGAVSLLGLGMNHVAALREAAASESPQPITPPKSVIYVFLSGGLGQHDSFDLKPDAPADIRGEFKPIATTVPGTTICEHLPQLAARAHLWSLVRSLTHPSNDHSLGHHIMLTGQSIAPPGFSANEPRPSDWPALASVVSAVTARRNNLPPAVVLPEKLIHRSGRVIPGQFAGVMGSRHEPFFVESSAFSSTAYGAYPEYGFHHATGALNPPGYQFQAPNLSIPADIGPGRFNRRVDLLSGLDARRRELEEYATVGSFDRYRQNAVSLLNDPRTRDLFDVNRAPEADQLRYGKNLFGWSLLSARRLVAGGVNLVQVNLGNNETWDTHGNAFPHLRDYLFPPLDRALSALLDDLQASGELDSTLIVMAGEFGRTPKVSHLPQHYREPGRDHWGKVQSVWLAGGGVRPGVVVGATDKTGGYPVADPQTPENLAATIYQTLGLPETTAWFDESRRPHQIFQGQPISGLL
jgi:hypothetical protein